MQQENVKNSKLSKISIQSIGSNFSAVIKDMQGNPANRSSWRQSLKNCMSIESDRKSDLYQKLINQGVDNTIRGSTHSSALGRQFKPDSGISRGSYDGRENRVFNSDYSAKPQLPNSNISDQATQKFNQPYEINHVCLCMQNNCEGSTCPCYSNDNECLPHLCCGECVIFKRKYLEAKERLLKQGIDNLEQYKPCTCKKTKCNKKYCACFSANRKCTNLCLCDECTNCDFYEQEPSKGEKPKTYIDMQCDKQAMPEKMDFEPVQFPQL